MSELLLTFLREHSNSRGLVIVREEALRDRLGVDREPLTAELRALETEGAIRILSPLPYLALKLRKWPGMSVDSAVSQQSGYGYPKQLLQPKRLIDGHRQEGDAETLSANENLMAEILETLGETDPGPFQRAIELYSPQVIRLALNRVARARGIRKSRTALFRHLLPRLAGTALTK